jgi:hypothetical protein
MVRNARGVKTFSEILNNLYASFNFPLLWSFPERRSGGTMHRRKAWKRIAAGGKRQIPARGKHASAALKACAPGRRMACMAAACTSSPALVGKASHCAPDAHMSAETLMAWEEMHGR